jgi:hypothetical protein
MAELEALTGFGLGIVCLVWANGSHSACVVVPVPTKSLVTKAVKSSRSSKESLPAWEPYLPSGGESGGFIRPAQIPLIQDVRSLSPLRQTRRTHQSSTAHAINRHATLRFSSPVFHSIFVPLYPFSSATVPGTAKDGLLSCTVTRSSENEGRASFPTTRVMWFEHM